MLTNIGKAIAVPLEGRDSNGFRKTLRSTISNRGLLKIYHYRTRVSDDQQTLVVWFEPKKGGDAQE
jgi:hypothetical protein